MWTNVFRIGELQTISWFQFFPCENDTSSLSDKCLKAEQKDAANYSILSAHLKLQNEGFLSTWTNSFVGPWDPSQGVHNPDEKIKLWLFLPGRHCTITENAQSAVSKLRVVGSGLWVAPGDSEEVGVALSQALRNSIERSIRGLSYVRFGDVFTRCHPLTSSIRGLQPTIEFVFAANEEAIYVHAVVSAKHVRGLISTDVEKLLWHFSSHSGEGIPVIVAPNGMRGRLTGCCPDDLVKQVYSCKLKASSAGAVGVSFPSTHHSNFPSKGQSCYVEVTLDCHSMNHSSVIGLNNPKDRNVTHLHYGDPHLVSIGRSQQKQGVCDPFTFLERTFIYPAEAVVIPMMHKAFARSSGKSLALGTAFNADHSNGLGIGYSSMKLQKQYNSSSNSVSSSISSISRTSSDSEHHMVVEAGDLEADADSLTCGQSGLSSKDHLEKDDNEMVSKRPRTGTTGKSVQAGKTVGANIHDTYMSEHSAQANNFAAAGVQNAQVVSFWGWDDDERGIGMDIQTLLSEFGDFGDFFEDDDLTFGEPPGTAESQALMFPAADYEDVTGSPCTGGIEIPDQNLVSVGLASLDDFSHQTVSLTEDYENRNAEGLKDSSSYLAISAPLSREFDHLTKAEAMMTFATEYAPVDASTSGLSQSIFKSPYFPRSRKVESSGSSSNSYVYNAIPPSSSVDTSEDQFESSTKHKLNPLGHGMVSSVQSSNLYTHIKSGGEKKNKRSVDNNAVYCNGEEPYLASGIKSLGLATIHQKKIDISEPGRSLLPLRTVLATDIECFMFQASMCRVRHTLLSHTNKVSLGLTSSMSEVTNDSNTKSDTVTVKYEARKRENIPVRIAGDFDGGLQDGSLAATVGVWRSVGAPKAAKPSRTSDLSPLTHNNLGDEVSNIQGHRQPLQDFLDALGFLVQQSTSFVDISLDSTNSNGSYYWLGVQEQKRRELACGPSMMHAGCGGLLSTCHSLDIAGVDLIDPLSADVQVSSAISLLHSDVKVSLKSAFPSVDGPISVTDWCKGRSHSGEPGATGTSEAKDSSSMVSLIGEPISPTQPAGASACSREGAEEQHRNYPRLRPTVMVLPLPAILVGYQDDWLKTSVNSLQLWEKAPLEPYALPKPVTYFALCPDIDLLTSASVDFFQQLGTVYEMCKLGSHSPQICGGQLESSPGICLPSGLVLVDCPQQMKISASHLNVVGTLTDYFVALSKSWNVKDFVKALIRLIRSLNLSPSSSVNQKEGISGACTVLYVICPFPEPKAVLQTLVECSSALGSVLTVDKEKRALLHSQVAKALNCTASVDEALSSNVVMLSGFTVSKLVLQIITIETLLKVNRPISELSTLRDIAFTVYNKARRIPRTASNSDMLQSSPLAARSSLMHMSSPIPGLWKDCLAPRMSGPSISREGELDAALRPATWESSWQTPRIGGLGSDQNRYVDGCVQDDTRYMFEPYFILAEPGSVEHGTSVVICGTGSTISETSSSRSADDTSGVYMQSSTTVGATDIGGSSGTDLLDHENKTPSLHCSYGWTEDWRWLVCLWTDSRGELLDSCIFPFGGISSQQDSKVLQNLFVQILQQGCQILSCASSDGNPIKPRDVIITRLGCFFELECQEWQKAFYSFGGNDVKKWPLQLRRVIPDGMTTNTNGNSLQQHDLSLIQERNLPSSPNPSLYSPHSKASFGKGGLGQVNSKKPLITGQAVVDNTRGLLQMVQSISLIGVSVDHSLNLMLQADMSSFGGTQGNSSSSSPSYLEGFSPLKSVGSMHASYLFIPSPSMRYLSSTPLQLPTFLTSESPPLAHLLHSKGSAIPLATGYVVSKAVPAIKQTVGEQQREDWPSVLSVSLVDHYGSNNSAIQERVVRSGGTTSSGKPVRNPTTEVPNKDYEAECRAVLESVAAELHSLSWMTTSTVFPERRSALPFHCDMILRLRRLLHFADKELSRPPENIQHA